MRKREKISTVVALFLEALRNEMTELREEERALKAEIRALAFEGSMSQLTAAMAKEFGISQRDKTLRKLSEYFIKNANHEHSDYNIIKVRLSGGDIKLNLNLDMDIRGKSYDSEGTRAKNKKARKTILQLQKQLRVINKRWRKLHDLGCTPRPLIRAKAALALEDEGVGEELQDIVSKLINTM